MLSYWNLLPQPQGGMLTNLNFLRQSQGDMLKQLDHFRPSPGRMVKDQFLLPQSQEGTRSHQHLLPPLRPKKITGVVAGGHHKVLVKTCGAEILPMKNRVARPRDDGNEKRGHGHGWFMVIDPVSGRILGVVTQDEPEGNAVVTQALLQILPYYPTVDLLIMDRCCHYMPLASKTSGLEQLKLFSWIDFTLMVIPRSAHATHDPKLV